MKVVAINGSPRRSRAISMLILDPFLQGLHEGGAKIKLIHLADLCIKPCQGCLDCWFRTPGACVLEDDMGGVLDLLREADLWVFATGLYWGGASGLLKNAMDRMLPLVEPFMGEDKTSCSTKLRQGALGGKLVLVSSAGKWGLDNFDPLLAQIKAFSAQISREFSGALLRPHGFALPHLMWLGKETNHVLDAARQLGKQMAKNGALQKKQLHTVGSELIPERVYIRHMNQEAKKGLTAQRSGERTVVKDSRLVVEAKPYSFEFKKAVGEELKGRIVETINRMGGIGPQAERAYQDSLVALRADAEQVVAAIAAEYEQLPETSYLDRWSLVHLMGELQHSNALSALEQIVESPIPTERSKVLHEYSTQAEELMIRTSAIEAVKRIASNKSEKAVELLLKQVSNEHLSIRRAAVQSYLEVGGRSARKKLKSVLPKEDQWLLTIRREDIRKVRQPQIFDSTAPRKQVPPLPPRIDEPPPARLKQSADTPTPKPPCSGESAADEGDRPTNNR